MTNPITFKGIQLRYDKERRTIVPNEPQAAINTDRELFREVPDDYYSPSLLVTADGKIGINVGGTVFVKSLREWHRLAAETKLPMFGFAAKNFNADE